MNKIMNRIKAAGAVAQSAASAVALCLFAVGLAPQAQAAEEGTPSVKLGVVAQRYPWNDTLDIQYRAKDIPNEECKMVITVTLPEGSTAATRQCVQTNAVFNGENWTTFDATVFGEVKAKDVKVRAKLIVTAVFSFDMRKHTYIASVTNAAGTVFTPDSEGKYRATANEKIYVTYGTEPGYFFNSGKVTYETSVIASTKVFPKATCQESPVQGEAMIVTGVTTNYYLKLSEAIAAATAGQKVEVVKNSITLKETLVVDKAIILDLGEKYVWSYVKTGDCIRVTAAATIQNGDLSPSLTADSDVYALHSYKTDAVYSNLTVSANHCRIAVYAEGADTVAACYGENEPTNTVNCYKVDVSCNGTCFAAKFTKMNLDADCQAVGVGDPWDYKAAVYSAANATITIAGGTYIHEKSLLSGNLGGKIVVNGGTLNGQIYSLMDSTAHPELNSDPNYKAQFTFNAGTYRPDLASPITFYKNDDASRALDCFKKGANVSIVAPTGFFWDTDGILKKTEPQ